MKALFHLWLVSALILVVQVAYAGDYVDNSNGTVTDNKTQLTWQKSEQAKMRWETAKQFCESLKLGGQSGWRLPTKIELVSLVERNMFNPCIDRRFFPDAKPDDYWTISQGTSGVGSAAWLVHFGYGDTHFFNKSNEYLVRCVR